MKQATLCPLIKDDQILLAMKKRGFGVGKWNGVGGKVEKGEEIIDAAIREIKERNLFRRVEVSFQSSSKVA